MAQFGESDTIVLKKVSLDVTACLPKESCLSFMPPSSEMFLSSSCWSSLLLVRELNNAGSKK